MLSLRPSCANDLLLRYISFPCGVKQLLTGGCMDSLFKKVLSIFSVGFAVFLIAIPAFSQGNTGRILGNITDTSGALIPGASVTITNVERGTSQTLVTNEAG